MCYHTPGDFMEYVIKHIDDYEQIECIHNEKCVGYINYRFLNRSVWLNKISVDSEYRGRGIGKTLLKLFENEAIKLRKVVVEGKFFPETNGEYVRRFYESSGYSIEKEGYDTELYKVLKLKHNLDGIAIKYVGSNNR